MLEGPELVAAGLTAGKVDAVYFDTESVSSSPRSMRLLDAARAAGVAAVGLAPGAIARATDTVSPQPVVATATPPGSPFAAVAPDGFVLVLCDVADPGNLGTAIRSADASGAAGVVVCGGVDVGNPKALRATAGSAFRLPIVVFETAAHAVDALHASDRSVLGAVVGAAPSLWATPITPHSSVVIGAEATGLSHADLALLDGTVHIPMPGGTESLNAGVAASLVCFEALRQRVGREGASDASPTI